MLTKRIIACLDMDGGRVVKGVKFRDLRDAGDPAECATAHARDGADEIVLLDITATSGNRGTLLDAVSRTARTLFVPFTVGGGIRQLADAAAVFDAGADKIAVNSAAVRDPNLISTIAGRFGSQAVLVAIDARRQNGGFEVFVAGGRTPTGRNAVEGRQVFSQSTTGFRPTSENCSTIETIQRNCPSKEMVAGSSPPAPTAACSGAGSRV